jgi:potassium-transporting ATPase potassium-binding subunit
METALILGLTALLAWPLARYMAAAFAGPTPPRWGGLWRPFEVVERLLYRGFGVNPEQQMSWAGYARAVLWTNLTAGVFALGVFMAQGWLPLNPDGVGGMSWDLALHTAASFVTNTNQQHYSGQAQLSYLSQMIGVTALQFITPATGLAAMVACLRALVGAQPGVVGNFYQDATRAVTRILGPLAVVWALALASQGVPATFEGEQPVAWLDPAAAPADTPQQVIPRGPVAPMVAIKQLGTNGGGWYGPNSAVPLENPTPLSNLLQTLAILLVPLACALMIGPFTGKRRLGWAVVGVMAALSVALIATIYVTEYAPSPVMEGLASAPRALEGKEVRFGEGASALWGTLTTQTSNGSVNAMHDSMNPLSGVVLLMGMLINSVWGGVGVGVINHLLYLLLTVFLAGLMVGRTPEIGGRKLTTREVQVVCAVILLQPLLILGPLAVALAYPGVSEVGEGFHAVSRALYEYTSAFANNGSGFEGLADGNVFWNVTCAVCLIMGRYVPMIAPLVILARLSVKRAAAPTSATLRVESPVFGLATVSVIVIVQLLSFLPVLVMGPMAEHWVSAPQVVAGARDAASAAGGER